jgi:hypothetical protein
MRALGQGVKKCVTGGKRSGVARFCAALLAALPGAGSAGPYRDADLQRSEAWIGGYLPVDVEPATEHRRMHCHRGVHKLLCRVWRSPGEGGRLYRTGHKPLDDERVYLVQRETEPASGRFADVATFDRTESGAFVFRPPAPPSASASPPDVALWAPDRGHGKNRTTRGESDYAMPFFASQPHLEGVVPKDLVGIGPPNARYDDCPRPDLKLKCGAFYSAAEKLRYRISLGSNEAGRTTVYDVWRETAPGSNALEIYAQWADGPANLLVEICGPVRPRPQNVAAPTSGTGMGSGAATAPVPSGVVGAMTRWLAR